MYDMSVKLPPQKQDPKLLVILLHAATLCIYEEYITSAFIEAI